MFCTNLGTRKLGVLWERIRAEIARNRTKLPKIGKTASHGAKTSGTTTVGSWLGILMTGCNRSGKVR